MGKPLLRLSDKEFWDWVTLRDIYLEKKIWFRFIRLVHVVSIIFISLVFVVLGYIIWSPSSLIAGSIKCEDGTSWSIMQNGSEMNTDQMCGVCKHRTTDNSSFSNCSFDETLNYSPNLINLRYNHDKDIYTTAGELIIPYLVVLVIERLIISGIVYVFAGSHKPNSELQQ